MPDATNEFFAKLRRGGHEPLLRNAAGTLRFDLADGKRVENWFVTVKRGHVAVSHRNAAADALVRCEKALFDGMARGEVNFMAAALRGAIVAQGDLGLVMSVARLLPGPPAARTSVPAAGYARRMQ